MPNVREVIAEKSLLIIYTGLGFDATLERVFHLPHFRYDIGSLDEKVGGSTPGNDEVDVLRLGIQNTAKSDLIDKPGI